VRGRLLGEGPKIRAVTSIFAIGWPFVVWGSARLARPDTRWAVLHYDEAKLARAKARHHVDVEISRERRDELSTAWEGQDVSPDEMDRTTRRALRKSGLLP
jgi:hypothetical protein